MPSNDNTLEGESDTDTVHAILSGSPFKIRPNNEKLDILEKGRPLYNLILKRDLTKTCNRAFHSSYYSIHKWLCGSQKLNKLFCWPCLLMRPESSSWCSIGNDDMKKFTSLAKKHARCKSHLKAIYEYDETLKNFGLPPEFISELKYKFKEVEEEEEEEEEEGSLCDKTEKSNDLGNTFLKNTDNKYTYEEKHDAKASNKMPHTPNISRKITFKTWQQMCQDNFPVSKSRVLEDLQLYKWKRKIAKQELRNAKLTGEKLQLEIEVLKEKLEYYKAIKQSTGINGESSKPVLNAPVF